MAQKANIITDSETSIVKSVLFLAWPVVIEMLLQMMVGIVDIAMVGRIGAEAITSVGFGNQIVFFIIAIFSAIGVGTTALVARYIGADEVSKANAVARQSLVLSIIISSVISLSCFIYAEEIIDIMAIMDKNPNPSVLQDGANYLRIVSTTLIFSFIMVIINSVFRGAGNTKVPMVVTGIVNIVNVIGNLILIFGWSQFNVLSFTVPAFQGLGVLGSAVSTATARGIGGLIVLYILFKGKIVIQLKLTDSYKIDVEILKKILNISLPAALEQVMMRGGQLIFAIIVASMGTIAYAGNQVTLNAESLSFMPGFAFALAATTLTGQNLGAKNPKRAEECGFVANRLAIIIMSFMGVIFFFFSKELVQLFTSDPLVIKEGATSLKIVAFAQPALATTMVLAGALRGAGDTKWVLYITASGIWLIRVTLVYLLGITFDYGLVGAWIAITIDLIVRGILFYWRFYSGKWKSIKI